MSDNLGIIIFYIFASAAGVQVLYYLIFFSRVAFYNRKFEEELPPQEPLSVIICAKNEERSLPKNLPAVLQQRYHERSEPAYEVTVVNDNSEDDSKYYLASI